MSLTITAEPTPMETNETGTVRVRGSRVTPDIPVGARDAGRSAEQIAEDFDTVSLADIYSVLAYCLRRRTEVAAYLSRREAEALELRRRIEIRQGTQPSREVLPARVKARREG